MASKTINTNDREGLTPVDGLFAIARELHSLVALLTKVTSGSDSQASSGERPGERILQIVSQTSGLSKWKVISLAGGAKQSTELAVDNLIADGQIVVKEATGKSHAQLLYLPEGG